MSAVDRNSWEESVVVKATHFIVSRQIPRARGQLKRDWDTKEFLRLTDACANAGTDPRVLIYAVAGTESFPVSLKDRDHFITLRKEA